MSTTNQLKTAIATQAARPIAQAQKPTGTFIDIVRSKAFQGQMAMALPKAITAERMTRIIMTECRKTPALLNTNRESFLGAVLQCAQLGIEPGSALGHAYLLPFGNGKAKDGKPNCQLIIGYRGMIDLARRSGQIVSINAYVVHEKDEFDYQLGLHPDITHRPYLEEDAGRITFVYAVAQLKDGGVQFEVMSKPQIDAVRKASKAGTSGPWVTHYEEMAKKTVIRRLFKYLPVSIEAARAVEVDEKTDRGEMVSSEDFVDGDFIEREEPADEQQQAEEPAAVAEPQ